MKKVLQISKYYYPFIGGIEQVARDIALVLKESDIEQKIICFNEDAKDSRITCHKDETTINFVDGVEVIRCGYQLKMSSQSISMSYPKELRKLMNEFNPDIIIFHYPNPYVAHFLLKYRKRNFKLILYWHLDITKQKFLGKIFHYQNIRLVQRANKIVGATPKHIEESAYSRYFSGKEELIPYMIDEKKLKITEVEKRKALEIKAKHKNQLIGFFVGRHVPYKGLQYLIEALKYIKNDNIYFYIAGKGILTEELRTLSKNDNRIEFIGQISDSDLRMYLYACDIFCFPSITRNEAFGLALAEGMYYGKAAVTFNIPGSGVNYVNINGVTGIECPNCDSEAYAIAIEKLCNNYELRKEYGDAARTHILNNFTAKKFDENINKLINEL